MRTAQIFARQMLFAEDAAPAEQQGLSLEPVRSGLPMDIQST
jgi:hypothetical protein